MKVPHHGLSPEIVVLTNENMLTLKSNFRGPSIRYEEGVYKFDLRVKTNSARNIQRRRLIVDVAISRVESR